MAKLPCSLISIVILIHAGGCSFLCPGYPTFLSFSRYPSGAVKNRYKLHQDLGLREKALRYERNLEERHYTSDGLVAYKINLPLKERGDIERLNLADTAAWTGCYLAAEAFRYAVTGEPAVLQKIRKTLAGLSKLQAVTGVRGLLARTIIKADQPDPYLLRSGEWHPASPPFRGYFWRGDVSNDQYDGVLFGYAVCYDLVPQASIRQQIREAVADLVNHIVDHGMTIVDVDGQVTTHGDMSPCSWEDLDALLALSFLRIAIHVTAEPHFEEKYRELIQRHGYHHRAASARKKWWECFLGINHSDNNLAFLAYYNLIRLEEDPRLLSHYLRGLERAWTVVKEEGNSLFNFIYLALTRPPDPLIYQDPAWQSAIDTLYLFPSNKLVVEVINSHRSDIKKAWLADRHGHPQAQHPLPINLRPVDSFEWKANPYRLDGHRGARGKAEYAGVDYLLAYWLGRYHGFISEGM